MSAAGVPRVGILALQGDVSEHAAMLSSLGAETVLLRRVEDVEGIDALVLPGGESTTIALLMASTGLDAALGKLLAGDLPVLGTCAGMIMLASEVLDGRADQTNFGRMDVAVRRNGYGRQMASFESDLEVDALPGGPLRAVFIRAPRLERCGTGVDVLARDDEGTPVLCRQGSAIACSFHPELAGDARLHALLLEEVR